MSSNRFLRPTFVIASVLALATSACSSPATNTAPASVPAAPAASLPDNTALGELLRDSWAVGQDGGYFVDDAWSISRSSFSLYETYWQLRWRERLPDDLERARMSPWLAAGAVGRLPSTGLQVIAQIGHSVEIAQRAGIAVDKAGVAKKIKSLRSGSRYAADAGERGTWGSTVVAVRTLRSLDLPVPPSIRDAVLGELRNLPKRLDPQTVIETAIPLLELSAMLAPESAANDAKQVARAADNVLNGIAPSAADASWLGAKYPLSVTMRALGLAPTRVISAHCDKLINAAGVVTLPGRAGTDTQATFYARSLGCPGVTTSVERPRTRAGWITGSALDPQKTLAATAAGMRIATLIGRQDVYAPKVRATIRRQWLPMLTDSKLTASDRAVAYARLSDVAKLIGFSHDSTPRAVATDTSTPLLIRLLAAENTDNSTRVALAKEAARTLLGRSANDPASIDVAVMFAIVGRILGDAKLTDHASQITTRLRISPGVYASAECQSTEAQCDSMRPSAVASAFGAWVDRTNMRPLAQWQKAGICTGYICKNQQDDGLSLRTIAVTTACTLPGCGTKFPMPI